MARLLLFVGVSLHVVTAAHAQDASPPVVELDFPGLEIGVAEYDEGPTGTTVFYFPSGAMAAADGK